MYQGSTYIYRTKQIKQTATDKVPLKKYIHYLLKHANIFQPIGQIVQFIAVQSVLLTQHSPDQTDDGLSDSTYNDLTSYR
jgi:hypothetical protein